jgi:hypothetical protein
MNILNNEPQGLIADHRPERCPAGDWLRYPKNLVEKVLAVRSALPSRSGQIEREIGERSVHSAGIVHSPRRSRWVPRALADRSAAFRN